MKTGNISKMIEGMDLVDRRILDHLDKDARSSYSAIGKRIKVPKETVKYRIRQLERKGIIRGYYTVLDFTALGFNVYRFYLRLQSMGPEEEREFIEHLRSSANVSVLYRTNGPYHIAMAVWARDVWELEAFWTRLKERFGSRISAFHLSIMCQYLEFSRDYLLPQGSAGKRIYATIADSPPAKCDEQDIRILTYISDRARSPLTAIARATGMGISTVRQRLSRLTKRKVVLGFRTTFDLAKLGRQYYKVDLRLSRFTREDEMRRYLRSQPEVAYMERTVATSDMEFDLEIEGFARFMTLMERLRERFPEEIRDYEYYSLVRNYKISYMPQGR